ncbi:MAG: class I SAM-dependent methyltransferase [Planctomycetes bacterium]|nr:class I SAM-dependent methyltransferase [Planctomycetota bacterium]
MNARTCNVCASPLGEPIYRSRGDVSITSLCDVLRRPTEVYWCRGCGHLLTPPLDDLGRYYGEKYKILIDSEEEDQLYEYAPDGTRTYRADHQLNTLLGKTKLPPGTRVLDFGCAKGATFRRLAMLRPDLELHLFDVSDMYRGFWERFVPIERTAVRTPPREWEGRFDMVTSFYSLEHVEKPREVVAAIVHLLRPGGVLYAIVPDPYRNVGDFVVCDHVNHFSRASISRLFADAGLRIREIDSSAHESAWVAVGEKDAAARPEPPGPEIEERVREMAGFWSDFGDRVRGFEAAHADRAAIYGSGFYGTFVGTCLAHPDRIAAFLDQNPWRQGKELLDRPIVAPDALPPDVGVVYVGLNPRRAREEIAKVAAFRDRNLTFFYP